MGDALTQARAAARAGSLAGIEAALSSLPDAGALVGLLDELTESVQDLATTVILRTLPRVDVTALAGLADLLAETSATGSAHQRAVRHEQALRFCTGEENVMAFETALIVVTRCLVAEAALRQAATAR